MTSLWQHIDETAGKESEFRCCEFKKYNMPNNRILLRRKITIRALEDYMNYKFGNIELKDIWILFPET